jgi:hypothetical protein
VILGIFRGTVFNFFKFIPQLLSEPLMMFCRTLLGKECSSEFHKPQDMGSSNWYTAKLSQVSEERPLAKLAVCEWGRLTSMDMQDVFLESVNGQILASI